MKLTTDWPKSCFKALICMKNKEIFWQLPMVDMGMVENVSSRVVDFRWNHGDPTVGSSKISSGCSGYRLMFLVHCRPSLHVLLHNHSRPLVGVPWSYWTSVSQSEDEKPFVQLCRDCCKEKKVNVKKEKNEKKGSTGWAFCGC